MTIPPPIAGAVAYGGNYQTIPITTRNTPPGGEGPKSIPGVINWAGSPGTNPGSAIAVLFNASLQTVAPISQIAAIYVDNTNCQADNITFYFPDTQFQFDVPAFTSGWFPVATNGLQFYIIASNPIPGDQTVFNVFNIPIRPFAITESVGYKVGYANNGISLTSSSVTTIFAGSTVIRDLQITCGFLFGTADMLLQIALEDINSNLLWATTFGTTPASTDVPFLEVLHWSNINLRVNGLKLLATVSAVTNGIMSCNILTTQQ